MPLCSLRTCRRMASCAVQDITPPERIEEDPKCDREVTVYGYLRGANLKPGTQAHLAGVGDMTVRMLPAWSRSCQEWRWCLHICGWACIMAPAACCWQLAKVLHAFAEYMTDLSCFCCLADPGHMTGIYLQVVSSRLKTHKGRACTQLHHLPCCRLWTSMRCQTPARCRTL